MLKFISKAETFRWLDEGLHSQLAWPQNSIHLKTWQDMAVYDRLKGLKGKVIGEVGGGDSRILHKLKLSNTCFNIDKFEGQDGGPPAEINIPGVTNVLTYLGESSVSLPPDFFDVVYSVSVVEHVPNDAAPAFISDLVRVLKPGGISLHAIDLYVSSDPVSSAQARVDIYASWLRVPGIAPLEIGPVPRALFHSSMASNPDLTMWNWSRSSPAMRPIREERQSVTMLFGIRKL